MRGSSEKLKKHGTETLALKCDITQPEDVQPCRQGNDGQIRKDDILVNNSGATWGAPAEEMPLEAWRK